ncbi:MAG TPA: metalloregulator ArsR/SmtB family transcription factor [Candidatus Dormibacteraeota bacterium]|jgi:ArsR family transcriptional regulator
MPSGPVAVAVVRQRGTSCDIPVRADPEWAERTASVLKALGDRTRLSMVAALRAAEAPVCICDFTLAYQLSQPTISHHMAKLRDAGLVESNKQGIWIYYRLRHDLTPSVEALLEALLRDVPAATDR